MDDLWTEILSIAISSSSFLGIRIQDDVLAGTGFGWAEEDDTSARTGLGQVNEDDTSVTAGLTPINTNAFAQSNTANDVVC